MCQFCTISEAESVPALNRNKSEQLPAHFNENVLSDTSPPENNYKKLGNSCNPYKGQNALNANSAVVDNTPEPSVS